MAPLDQSYPVFVLAFCVFDKHHYAEIVAPAVEKFKFRHFGHSSVVLHETDIRKEKGCFSFFHNREHKECFIAELTEIIDASKFTLIACVVDKVRLGCETELPPNPYHLALGFCLEALYALLCEKGELEATTHVLVECRGRKEDRQLAFEFRKLCEGANRLGKLLPFEVVFADKKINSAGLQLADLVARPIGLHVLRPTQANRAFDILDKKFFCGNDGYTWLTIYPTQESEKPR